MYLILNVYKNKYPCGRTGQDLVHVTTETCLKKKKLYLFVHFLLELSVLRFFIGFIGLISIFQKKIKRVDMILKECSDCLFTIILAGYTLVNNRYPVSLHKENDVMIL